MKINKLRVFHSLTINPKKEEIIKSNSEKIQKKRTLTRSKSSVNHNKTVVDLVCDTLIIEPPEFSQDLRKKMTDLKYNLQ